MLFPSMRAVSVIYVASALVWAVSSAPIPEEHMESFKSRTGLDEFSELDLSMRASPFNSDGTVGGEAISQRIASPSGCIIV
ncbi:hypothetical protein DFH08DRAFT_896465 [Mycena albidolilacea]|uniref:Uncharacterized protein n=1 Tax=Mycena albidolilacea TaxID=1033008 RepID=A0AAD6Z906_9AGAR|nr:hypothetical protein DFH08DRAFT_896465 [Mycena albidolilacea]